MHCNNTETEEGLSMQILKSSISHVVKQTSVIYPIKYKAIKATSIALRVSALSLQMQQEGEIVL